MAICNFLRFSNAFPDLSSTKNWHEFSRDCAVFAVCPDNQLHFEQPIPFHSTAFQFGWLCGADAYKRALYSQAQFGGVLLGTFTSGALSDAFGRRPIAICALTFGISSVLASAFATTWQFLLATRFMVGLSIGGTLVVVCTFVMELILPAQRMCSQLVVILCFVLLSWLVLVDHNGIGILLINVIGTVFIEFTWDACYLCSVESVPTPLRASSVGSCSLVARIGALFAPMLVFLNSFWAVSVYLAVVLLGTLNLTVSCLWLVETKGISLDSVRLAQMSAEDEADAGGMEGMKRNDERTPTGNDIEGADQALVKP
ncbi:hypothetical protein niasHT_014592 [Heterodera trifolii]|uniref:Major facilitator superfamily (MFS) profile domain-containing protein n=1 Tax=Heterodera trifolii TaxID=157864 RepID=A0ABD2LI15_9BILA